MESIMLLLQWGLKRGCTFSWTAKLIVQALRKGKTANGDEWKDKLFTANAFNGMVYKGKAS
jgi:hypothetical protein